MNTSRSPLKERALAWRWDPRHPVLFCSLLDGNDDWTAQRIDLLIDRVEALCGRHVHSGAEHAHVCDESESSDKAEGFLGDGWVEGVGRHLKKSP